MKDYIAQLERLRTENDFLRDSNRELLEELKHLKSKAKPIYRWWIVWDSESPPSFTHYKFDTENDLRHAALVRASSEQEAKDYVLDHTPISSTVCFVAIMIRTADWTIPPFLSEYLVLGDQEPTSESVIEVYCPACGTASDVEKATISRCEACGEPDGWAFYNILEDRT